MDLLETVANLGKQDPLNIRGIDAAASQGILLQGQKASEIQSSATAIANDKAQIADKLELAKAQLDSNVSLDVSTMFANMQNTLGGIDKQMQVSQKVAGDSLAEAASIRTSDSKNPIDWFVGGLKEIGLRAQAKAAQRDATALQQQHDTIRAVGMQSIQDTLAMGEMQNKTAIEMMGANMRQGLAAREADVTGQSAQLSIIQNQLNDLTRLKMASGAALRSEAELQLQKDQFKLQSAQWKKALEDKNRADAMRTNFVSAYKRVHPDASAATANAVFNRAAADPSGSSLTFAMLGADEINAAGNKQLSVGKLLTSGIPVSVLNNAGTIFNIPELAGLGADFINRRTVEAASAHARTQWANYQRDNAGKPGMLTEKQFYDQLDKSGVMKQIQQSALETVQQTYGAMDAQTLARLQGKDYNFLDTGGKLRFLSTTDPSQIASFYKITDPKVLTALTDTNLRLKLSGSAMTGRPGAFASDLVNALSDMGVKNPSAVVSSMYAEDAKQSMFALNPATETLAKNGLDVGATAAFKDADGNVVDLTNPAQLDNYVAKNGQGAFANIFGTFLQQQAHPLDWALSKVRPTPIGANVDQAAIQAAVREQAQQLGIDTTPAQIKVPVKPTRAAPAQEPAVSFARPSVPEQAQIAELSYAVSTGLPNFGEAVNSRLGISQESALVTTLKYLQGAKLSDKAQGDATVSLGIIAQGLGVSPHEAAKWLLSQQQFLTQAPTDVGNKK